MAENTKINARSPRWLRKKAKLEMRGTYQRHGIWYWKQLEQGVVDTAESLARSITNHTGNPCDFREILWECKFTPKYVHI